MPIKLIPVDQGKKYWQLMVLGLKANSFAMLIFFKKQEHSFGMTQI